MKKTCLYKFTHVSLLKNDALFKQKSDKKTIIQIYQEIRIISRKKNHKKKRKKRREEASTDQTKKIKKSNGFKSLDKKTH